MPPGNSNNTRSKEEEEEEEFRLMCSSKFNGQKEKVGHTKDGQLK